MKIKLDIWKFLSYLKKKILNVFITYICHLGISAISIAQNIIATAQQNTKHRPTT